MISHKNIDYENRAIPISCNLDCGGDCPLLAHIKESKIVKISNNPLGGPYMSGCIKGLNMDKVLYSPERLTKPLIRTGTKGSGRFKEITWDYALDLIAEKLTEIKNKHGNNSIIFLGGSGAATGALHNTVRLPFRFLSLFGGFTCTTAGYSSAAAKYSTPYVLGTQAVGIDPETLQYSNLIILWGANVVDTRLETMLEPHIREAKEKGIEIIVIDPRRTLTVKTLGTSWIPIFPGTDIVLMAALLYVLIEEKLIDRNFVLKYSYGFEELEKYIVGDSDGIPKTPQWAESLCGTTSEQIISLARKYGEKHPTALIPGLSIQRTIGGEEAIRMAIALQTATGNLGVLGGSSGGLTWGRLPPPKMGALSINPNSEISYIPVYVWPDAILEGKKGGYPSNINAIYNVGGNMLIQGSDIHKNIRAFKKVEFSVCHERFLTPTAMYCDIVLPVTFSVERNDIIIPDGGNYLLFSNQAIPPIQEVRNDYDIFCQLADRLGFLKEFSEEKKEEDWLRSFTKDSVIRNYEEFKRSGIYFAKDNFRVGLSDFIEDPITNPLNTPSGLIQISSQSYAETGFSPYPECRIMQPVQGYPLRLVTPKSRYRIHSQNYNIPWFKEKEKQELWMNSSDAASKGIKDNEEVIVKSPQGVMRIPAYVTDEIMPGVVSILEGAWVDFNKEGVETAGSVNVLTSTVPTLPSYGSRTHSVLVQVEKVART
jgi:anaerobic dimethyl sulfoxide reductase subunit A